MDFSLSFAFILVIILLFVRFCSAVYRCACAHSHPTNLVAPCKPELIIRESQPIELPPDVVRSSDKTDLGLGELQQLNVRERYNMFENGRKEESHQMLDREERLIKRGTTVLSKLAK